MKTYIALAMLLLPAGLQATENINDLVSPEIKTVSSPANRVAVLELYTSEGCSSCPPADRFLSRLKQAGISDRQLIPMAFHVTYWDYIGWSDRFASKRYDRRQRDLASKNNLSTIYTPQFVLSGDDYRRYSSFNKDVNKIVREKASVDIHLTMSKRIEKDSERIQLKLESDLARNGESEAVMYLAILEDNLSSVVDDGENEGETLTHDYVVRKLLGPYDDISGTDQITIERDIVISPEWKTDDLSIIAFVEDGVSGEVLQAVRLDY